MQALTSTKPLEDLLHSARARFRPFGCLQAVLDRVQVFAVKCPEERFGPSVSRKSFGMTIVAEPS